MKGTSIALLTLGLTFRAVTASAGDDQNTIIGGDVVQTGDPIAQTTVMLQMSLLLGTATCSASIIGDDTLVSAGHCVTGSTGKVVSPTKLKVVFKLNKDAPGTTLTVIGAEVAPGWKGESSSGVDQHDISVIRIRGALPAGYRKADVLPISKPLIKGETVTLAGYGVTNAKTHDGAGTLRKVDDIKVDTPALGKTETVLDQTQGKGACHGDSGGPAFVKQNGEYLLWGLTNRGYPETAPDDCAHFAVYTQINRYSQWIAEATARLHQKH